MDKPAFQQLQAQLVKRPPVESLRATGGCTLEIHRQVLKGRLRGQRADASTGHAEAFAADSCSDLLVFLLDMNNAPFVIDSVFISLSLIKGAYQFPDSPYFLTFTVLKIISKIFSKRFLTKSPPFVFRN